MLGASRTRALALVLSCSALLILSSLSAEDGGGAEGPGADGTVVELLGSGHKKQPAPSISDQVAEAQQMFDESEPAPSLSPSHSPLGLGSGGLSAAPGGRTGAQAQGLGLKGMTQKEFEAKVKGAVTKKVAAVLVRTMRPLKRVLREQQKKIDQLRKQRQHLKKMEKEMAEREATKLKDGLLSHLKRDVDAEVKSDLTPKALLKAEKSKAKLKKKLEELKKEHLKDRHHSSDQEPHASEKRSHKQQDHREKEESRSARHHSRPHIPSPLDHHHHPHVVVPKSSKKKCDPLASLYKTGLVSWC